MKACEDSPIKDLKSLARALATKALAAVMKAKVVQLFVIGKWADGMKVG